MRVKRQPWTASDLAVLKQQYPHVATAKIAASLGRSLVRVYSKAAALGLKKSEEYLASPDACRLRRGDNVGASRRFLPGHVPVNKGVKGWDAGGRSHETRFKPGQRGSNWVPIGSERLMDGYLQRKVSDTGYPPRDWKAVHVLLWEQHYGPVPPGYAISFIDGDKRHIDLTNLVMLSRRELMLRNTIHRYPPELRQAIRLVGKLNRAIKRADREEQD